MEAERGEEWGEVQKFFFLYHPITLSEKSVARSNISQRTKEARKGDRDLSSFGICKFSLINLLWEQ